MNYKAIISIAVSVGLTFILWNFIPESHCFDGWKSLSIGSSGACSHHGGVKSYGYIGILILACTITIGIFLYNFLCDSHKQQQLSFYINSLYNKTISFFRSRKGISLIALACLIGGFSIAYALFGGGAEVEIIEKEVIVEKQVPVYIQKGTSNTVSTIQNTDTNLNTNVVEKMKVESHNLDDCGEGGRMSEISNSCFCDLGYGINNQGKCEKKYCGEGGRYSDLSGGCSCDFGFGKNSEGICEKKDCGEGKIFSEISNSCIKNYFE